MCNKRLSKADSFVFNCNTLTAGDTILSEGRRNNNLPNRIGWLGYCVRQYSSRAHCDFSCSDSMWATSDRPQASMENIKDFFVNYDNLVLDVYEALINIKIIFDNDGENVCPSAKSLLFSLSHILQK